MEALPSGYDGALRIVSVSHCWHGGKHPDPKCEQLRRLAVTIEREQDSATCTARGRDAAGALGADDGKPSSFVTS